MSQRASPTPSAPATPWANYVLAGGVGALLGATIMWTVLRNQASLPAHPPTSAMSAASNPDPTTHVPTPDLTAGMPPAQADRTLGNFYYDHQNWAQAIARYESAIRQGTDDADIRTDLGNSYRFSGRADAALAQYALAQQMDPNHEFSLFNQGGLYFDDLHQPAKAIEIWEQYLKRFPSGRNVALAQQLIAQARGAPLPAATAPGTTATVAPDNATESLILRQIQAGKTSPSKP